MKKGGGPRGAAASVPAHPDSRVVVAAADPQLTSTVARYAPPALIFVLAFVCFLPALSNGFVNWDDLPTFQSNLHYRGLSLTHLRWMFTTVHMGHYQPLSWVTHALVYTIWGMDPFGYHLVNLLLHAANALVFYFLIVALLRQNQGGSAPSAQLCVAAGAGALFFAIHPLRVEVVAWATERRELLSGFFLLLSLRAYVRMCAARRTPHHSGRTWLLLSLGFYFLSLLSKATGLTFPVVLLVLDVYPLRRCAAVAATGLGRSNAVAGVLLEKIAYAVLAAGTASVAFFAQRESTAALSLASYSLQARVLQAFYGLWFYLWKTLLPIHLSPLYLLQPFDAVVLQYVGAAVVIVGTTAALIMLRRRYPWALAAWACYVVVASPVLGLVQSGPQVAADRYTYLSCLPWAVLVAAAVDRLWDARPLPQAATLSAAALLAVVFAVLSVQQTYVWRSSRTLWDQVVRVEPDNYMAYYNRGHAREDGGDLDGALADYDIAIRLSPLYADALAARGHARQAKGDNSGAIADYNATLRLEPRNNVDYNHRGVAREAQSDAAGALADFEQALQIDPEQAEAYYNRGNSRQARGDLDGAIADYDSCLRFSPQYFNAYTNRGNARQAKGDRTAALADFSEAIRVNPHSAEAYYNRANARKAAGDLRGAIDDYSQTLHLNPQNASAYNNRGNARKALGDVDGALGDFDQAVRLNPSSANAYNNRGMVRRAKGDLQGAVADFSRALELTPASGPLRSMVERNLADTQRALQEHGQGQ